MPESPLKREQIGFLFLATLLVFSSHALPEWTTALAGHYDWSILEWLGRNNFLALLRLLFSIILIANDPAGYGVKIGQVHQKWRWILLMCATPILFTAIVYPWLPNKPFSGGPRTIWLISPVAQDLLFAGYFYQRFSQHFPGTVYPRIAAKKTILLTAFYFALWHTPGIAYSTGGYIWFQLLYTFIGACAMGLLRQYCDSLIYIVLVHMAVNWIAVTL